MSAVAALTGCSRQTVLRHIAALKEQGAVDTRHNAGRTIVIRLRRGHGETRAFFNTVEAAMQRGANPVAHVRDGHTNARLISDALLPRPERLPTNAG